jgi:inner membrane protein
MGVWNMARLLSSKFAVIGFLVILFLIGLTMLSNLVSERQHYNEDVLSGIGKDYVNQQTIIAPYIVVPTTESQACREDIRKTCTFEKNIIVTPHHSVWDHRLNVSDENFKRGIYKAITYTDIIAVKGQFTLPKHLMTPESNQVIHWDKATIRLNVSDLRGLIGQPIMSMNGQKMVFNFPSDVSVNPLGMTFTEVPISLNAQTQSFDFALDFSLNGMRSLEVIPVGKDMSMTLNANWAHPSFYGASLPEKKLLPSHFSAKWQNTYVSNQNAERLSSCLGSNNSTACDSLQNIESSAFAVKFINAVDTYTMSNRTIKYALLFLMITFGAFFLFEVLKNLRIHPMQYTLVAAALGVFYLLLLSFSEHVGFALAYLGSSTACVLLLSFYVYYVLKGLGRTLILTSILSAMYGSMYVILQSEDLTLILGSVLVFVLIAIMMFLTRKVDWYAVSAPAKPI